jgi:Flp pilus assembly protein TadG
MEPLSEDAAGDNMIKRRSSRAQAMVEFALALPVFLMVLYGLIEASRLIFIVTTVASAAREGARYGSAGGGMYHPVTAQYEDCAGIRAAAKRVGFLLNLQDSDIDIEYDDATGAPAFATCPAGGAFTPPTAAVVGGNRIVVTVRYNYSPILVNFLPFTNKTLSSPRTARTLTGLVDMNNP